MEKREQNQQVIINHLKCLTKQQDILTKKLDDFIGHANDDQPDISSANELRLNPTTDNPPLNVPKEITAEVETSDSETPNLSASEPETC